MSITIGLFPDEAEKDVLVKIHRPLTGLSLTVSGGATPSATSAAIRIRNASKIVFTVDHNRAGSNSTNLSAELYTSVDGVTFDTDAYVSLNLGAAKIKSVPVVPGMNYVRWKVTNNDAANATVVMPIVTVML